MAPATYSSTGRSPPLGIKIICVLGALGGGLGLFGSLVLLGASPLVGLFALVISIAQLIVVVGLWNLRSWAWSLALVVYGLGALGDVLEGDILGLLISLIVIGYLLSQSHLFN